MASPRHLRSALGLVVVLGLVVTSLATPGKAMAAQATLPAWHGGIDLYRDGTFTTQRSWLWCTAAGVQIVRNIVDRRKDHSTSGQRAYFAWMRDHNRYDLPESAGVDPAGWTAGLRHFVDDRYRLVSSRTFDEALHSAVERMRLTNLPVAITVSHGGHGWILTGFRATADPATTASFKVTSVRVVGPLYGRQSKNGYDMPPNTKLTPTQLKHFFTRWKYDPKPMIWDGRYVSIQPFPAKAAAPASGAVPTARPAPTPATAPTPPSPATPSPSLTTTQTASPTPIGTPSARPLTAVLSSGTPRMPGVGDDSATASTWDEGIAWQGFVVVLLAASIFLVASVALGYRVRRGRSSG